MGQLTFQATLGGAVNLAGPNTASTTTFTLPAADGTNGQALTTNGSGTLSFASIAASQWTTTGSNIYYNTGLVGIGAIPVNARKLTVSSAGQSDLSVVAGSSDYGQLLFGYVGADNKGIVGYNNSDNSMQFYTNNTERARFNSSGAFVLAGGTTSANGIGITFPATQSASSNANTLDDYEEGTFSPTYVAGYGSFTSITYGLQDAKYTKIGNMVSISIYIYTSAVTVGSANTAFTMIGLPFTASADSACSLAKLFSWNFGAVTKPINASIGASTTIIYFFNGAYDDTFSSGNYVFGFQSGTANRHFINLTATYFV